MLEKITKLFKRKKGVKSPIAAVNRAAFKAGLTRRALLQAEARIFIETLPTHQEIWQGITNRQQAGLILTDKMLTRWFERFPQDFDSAVAYSVNHSSGPSHYRQIKVDQVSSFPLLRAAYRKYSSEKPGSVAYNNEALFRRFASREEWHTEVVNLLDNKVDQDVIAHQLENIHLEKRGNEPEFELPDDLLDALIRVYGDKALRYVNFFSLRRFTDMIDAALKSNEKNTDLLKAMNEIQQQNWSRFRHYSCEWAKPLYIRDAAFFATFIYNNIDAQAPCIGELTAWARRDGHDVLYTKLAARWDNRKDWNDDLRHVLKKSDLTIGQIQKHLQRLDVKRSGWYVSKIAIDDDVATVLYQRNPGQFREFVWRYLPAHAPGQYPQLLAAAQTDEDFYIRVFRRAVTPQGWAAEMDRLYEQNLPADKILAALEARKPSDTEKVSPKILHKFLERYGEAVVPYFQHYIDWVTPERMNALFALDLSRGDLQRELRDIARRQRTDFASRAELWALQLYKIDPDYFGSFIVQNLGRGWRGNDSIGKKLLARMEAEGRYDLFKSLYPNVYFGQEWEKEIQRLIKTTRDDSQLMVALDRRATEWTQLEDNIAVTLYQRNAEHFRTFIKAHTTRRNWNTNFKGLESAARRANDQDMLDHLVKVQEEPQQKSARTLRMLLAKNLAYDQFLEAAGGKDLGYDLYRNRDGALFFDLVRQYGDQVMPELNRTVATYTYWNDQLPAPEKIKPLVSEQNYWRYVFARRDYSKWIEGLQALLKDWVDDEQFAVRLTMLTPDQVIGTIPDHVAAPLYKRSPSIARPFLERFLGGSGYTELFNAVREQGDEPFLDFLTYLAMSDFEQSSVAQAWQRRRQTSTAEELDKSAQAQIALVQTYVDRLNTLYAESPAQFVQHAASIIRHIPPVWTRSSNDMSATTNPIWIGAVRSHQDAWQQNAGAIRDLLESPNIHVQIAALNILSQANLDSAARVIENLPRFRVLLLSNTFKETKRKTLSVLESAALFGTTQGTLGSDTVTAPILTLLSEVVNFVAARRSISDEVALTMARILSPAPLTVLEAPKKGS